MGQTPLAQRMAAAYELMHRLGKDYEKPEFGIRTVEVGKAHVAIHERVEIDKPFCELRRFKRYCDDPETLLALKKQPVVLIVAPLSGHYATLLRDTVRTMLQDHKVYITDWKNARLVPLSEGEFHLDDYVNYVQGIHPLPAGHLRQLPRDERVPAHRAGAGRRVADGQPRRNPAPVHDHDGRPDRCAQVAHRRQHPGRAPQLRVVREQRDLPRAANFPGAGRRVYPGFLQHTGFIAMNPDRHANSHYDYFKDLIKGDLSSAESHRKFYDEYNAVLDMDADYYLETINTVFQDFKLVNGTWDVRNEKGVSERVRPQDITRPAC
jgi:poly(3-hydroxybutyrate) depolymerase